ncbi:AraC-like DNA-binding protein [Aquimarina sp. EL_43]|uniref:AraC family transcriptional regulator n=1 Tax=unclassified Aquimarina TaxID=2627091 RepID=UPI0018C91226|nr:MULTISPECIES: AraC family transcriptional regulator [unclassified Aquimarina]MBG6131983.1 AraC-like DNA-binding protein [Aquimarina sp. EL_35]MBG6149547.1 AraC-like DNA-binding protein [Aquimarina sp. EL_32]MBG6170190.1 AraC-like DNA-binding protein [Aquimarina sp. EL_43]
MKKRVLIVSIFFLYMIPGIAQETTAFTIPDSLKNKTFDEVEELSYQYYRDTLKYEIYSNTFLAKAKLKNDSLALAKGYQLVSYNNSKNFPVRLTNLDSSIAFSKNLNHKRFPAISYSIKGGIYKEIGNYDKALDNYLAALKYSSASNNKNFYYLTKHNIGSIKREIGELDDAAKIFKEVIDYEEGNNIGGKGHLATILHLADSYRKLEYRDSATFYNTKGIQESLKDSLDIYPFFVLNEGINLFYKQQYQRSLDSIYKALPFIEKYKPRVEESLVNAYIHLAKLYKEFGENEKYLEYLLKINQSYERSGFVSMEMREGYELLIDYYKSIDDKNKQLYYIDKLFTVDSILDTNYKNLSKKIVLEYDTPKLLEEKQNLIDALEQKEKKTSIKFIIAVIFAIVLIIIVAVIYTKNVRYRKRFKELMQVPILDTAIQKEVSDKHPATPEAIGISEDIVNAVLEGLQKFEDKQGYLSTNITTGELAKKLQTNSKYLSKIINTYKQKSFSVYINELRIDYVIEKLKRESKFRLYTIKAISREIGFNTTEAFSKSFYKKTGIYPSYFIKQLEKENR